MDEILSLIYVKNSLVRFEFMIKLWPNQTNFISYETHNLVKNQRKKIKNTKAEIHQIIWLAFLNTTDAMLLIIKNVW